jgi:hypothetical protein
MPGVIGTPGVNAPQGATLEMDIADAVSDPAVDGIISEPPVAGIAYMVALRGVRQYLSAN